MKRRIFAVLTLFAGFMLPLSSAAADADIAPEDKAAIREVVQLQMDAVAEDDADTAFSLATADTQSRLGDSNTFLQLIKHEYAVIYRHQRAIFSAPELIAGQMVQVVNLTDDDNAVWVAMYQMQREPDGRWKIASCNLLRTTAVSI
jgi:hypothetical protein